MPAARCVILLALHARIGAFFNPKRRKQIEFCLTAIISFADIGLRRLQRFSQLPGRQHRPAPRIRTACDGAAQRVPPDTHRARQPTASRQTTPHARGPLRPHRRKQHHHPNSGRRAARAGSEPETPTRACTCNRCPRSSQAPYLECWFAFDSLASQCVLCLKIDCPTRQRPVPRSARRGLPLQTALSLLMR